MKSWESPLLLLCLACLIFSSLHVPASCQRSSGQHRSIVARRALLSFQETPKGSNTSYDCSPYGACVPCLYSEKKDERYRCSETGYRIPLKCVKIGNGKVVSGKKSQNGRLAMETLHKKVKRLDMLHEDAEPTKLVSVRALLEDSSKSEAGKGEYITYRSCIPALNEEKLSVIGFEVILLCLLLASGSFIYLRKKRSVTTMPGVAAVRIPTNSRF
ncbi:hypothetical protein BT93_L5531 [Corymbia citriodora subsp. variegata]|uniref:Uncharacterized protein n=1 Tax=Corymbia citriodora subsp. variegata TaxID=360336 RepID=A0A8T0CWK1_CORYI|nr:hypothetical protein BT93_L5531 [Corymbia citriodora subsp. variegata]